ncbi:hypothetical protein BV20DRAFT_292691 [Pilatotrama ljubarskyi]|nr:hypothetical protein BV20DRAFT_292691 [Pilatotrama ljubarskyi]
MYAAIVRPAPSVQLPHGCGCQVCASRPSGALTRPGVIAAAPELSATGCAVTPWARSRAVRGWNAVKLIKSTCVAGFQAPKVLGERYSR